MPMPPTTFSPPYTSPEHVPQALRDTGYAVLNAQDVSRWLDVGADHLAQLGVDWQELPPDDYLKDGGRYRRRRHACFVSDAGQLRQVPHRAHWQPLEYNALHGGMQRWFAPMREASIALLAWQKLLLRLAEVSDAVFAPAGTRQPWYLEAHQFRIDTTDGIGRPTPEGAHRDGVDLVAVFLVGREGVKGGETRVFEAAGPSGQRFTLTEPWSVLLLDDARMIHETTPIQPTAPGGCRDTLVVTSRRHGFQGDAP
jgi:hypothetical protein